MQHKSANLLNNKNPVWGAVHRLQRSPQLYSSAVKLKTLTIVVLKCEIWGIVSKRLHYSSEWVHECFIQAAHISWVLYYLDQLSNIFAQQGKRLIITTINSNQASDYVYKSEILEYLHVIAFLGYFLSNLDVWVNKCYIK